MYGRLLVTLLTICFLSLSPEALAKKKPTKAKSKFKRVKVYASPVIIPFPPPRPEEKIVINLGRRKTRSQLNSMFGIHVAKGSALVTGMQYGRRMGEGPLFLGVEYNFSLYSPGSILSLMGGGWLEFPIQVARGPSLSVGLVAGSGFTTAVIGTPTTVFMGYLDLTFAQPMDDLFDLRVQLRPGVMYQHVAFMMNLSIAFRFA